MDAQLKYSILLEILKKYQKVFIHVMPHEDLIIGRRGLIGDENQRGILLVFGKQSYKNLKLSEENLFVDMKFSGIWEELSIPMDCLYAIFDSSTNPEFIFNFKFDPKTKKETTTVKKPSTSNKDSKIIKVDFRKS